MSNSRHATSPIHGLMKGAVAAVGVAAPLLFANASAADTAELATPVAVIVRVPAPWYAPRFLIERKMRATIAEYQNVPGLSYKAYAFEKSSGRFGGIYLWKDRASAENWFNPAWFARVRTERHADADVQIFDVPVAIDNTPRGDTESTGFSGVATLVTIPVPSGMSHEMLVAGFRAAVPTHQKIDGLMRMYFIETSDGKFGGIYLWQDQSAAKAWLTKPWKERARDVYGAEPNVVWFDTPILTATRLSDNRVALVRP